MNTGDPRNQLWENINMILMGHGVDITEIKDELFIMLDKYEISMRTTEIALLNEDRNDYLLRKFIIAKTVKGCTERTISYYRIELTKILNRIGKTVDDITADDIRLYLAVRQKKDKVTKITADNELRCMRTFYQYLVREEIIEKDVTLKIDKIKYRMPKKKALTDIEVEKLRNAARGWKEKAMIEVLLSTGCRVSELVQIKLEEIEGNAVLIHGKGEKDRIVYMNAKAQLTVENYLAERKDANPYLFPGKIANEIKQLRRIKHDWYKNPEYVAEDKHVDKSSVEQMMRAIANRAGVEQANPHKLRRTCATMALKRGMPIEQVSRMLGHEQLDTTKIYLDLTDEELEQYHKKYVI